MVLKKIIAFLEALRRSAKYLLSMNSNGKGIIQGALSNFVKENFGLLALLSLIIALLGQHYLALSIFGASFSIGTLGADISLLTNGLQVFRFFLSPLDDLMVGSLITVGTIGAALWMGKNYFVSQYRSILENQE